MDACVRRVAGEQDRHRAADRDALTQVPGQVVERAVASGHNGQLGSIDIGLAHGLACDQLMIAIVGDLSLAQVGLAAGHLRPCGGDLLDTGSVTQALQIRFGPGDLRPGTVNLCPLLEVFELHQQGTLGDGCALGHRERNDHLRRGGAQRDAIALQRAEHTRRRIVETAGKQ